VEIRDDDAFLVQHNSGSLSFGFLRAPEGIDIEGRDLHVHNRRKHFLDDLCRFRCRRTFVGLVEVDRLDGRTAGVIVVQRIRGRDDPSCEQDQGGNRRDGNGCFLHGIQDRRPEVKST
jgi:hypothetical protein